MIAELKPYPEYKESGQEWLGKIPAHWQVKRLKNWVAINQKSLGDDTPSDYGFDYLDIASVTTGRLARPPSRMRFASAPSRARRVLQSDDTIISTVRTYLKAVFTVGECNQSLVVSTGFAVLSPRSGTIPQCLGYVAQSEAFTSKITAESFGIAYPAISETRLGNIPLTLPPPAEQAAIVRFLNHWNGRLEKALRSKRRVIALLQEQKQAIIHRAVTRGLDPNVQLKDSGIPWVGDIPAHWETRPNRSLFQIKKRLVGSRHPEFQVLSLTKRGVLVRDMDAGGKFSSFWERSQEVRPGNIVFCFFDVDETPRGVGLSHVHGMISPDYTVMECPPDPIVSFLELFYLAMDNRKLLKPLYTGLRKRISKPLFQASKTPIPPPEEMQAIIDFVKAETSDANTVITRYEREITLLREYRTRLTADVVTGKLDVRAAAAQLPEEAEDEPLPDPEIPEEETELEEIG